MKMHLAILFILLFGFLFGCAGNRTETTLNITGSRNTITCSQAPTTNKTSKTDTEVAGSGYGAVTK